MKFLLMTLSILNTVLVAALFYFVHDRTTALDQEIKKTSQAQHRLGGMTHQTQVAVNDLANLVRKGNIGTTSGGTTASTDNGNPEVAEGPSLEDGTGPSEDNDVPQELRLLDEMEGLERRRMQAADEGLALESLDREIDETIASFVDLGAIALARLPERVRSLHKQPDIRLFYLTKVLPLFRTLDPKGCYSTIRMVLLDSAEEPGVRGIAGNQAFSYDPERASVEVTQILSTIKRRDVQVAMLTVLHDNPVTEALDLIIQKALNKRLGMGIQNQAVKTLARYPDSKSIDALRELIEQGESFIQGPALSSLVKIEGEGARPYLQGLLEKPENEIAADLRKKIEAALESTSTTAKD